MTITKIEIRRKFCGESKKPKGVFLWHNLSVRKRIYLKLPHNGKMITWIDFEGHLRHEDRAIITQNILVQKARGDKTGLEPLVENILKICFHDMAKRSKSWLFRRKKKTFVENVLRATTMPHRSSVGHTVIHYSLNWLARFSTPLDACLQEGTLANFYI